MDAKHSFSIKNPKDLLQKMHRERERVVASSDFNSADHKYQYDHAINFAYTAWHLVDWVWRYLEYNEINPQMVTGCKSYNDFHNLVRSECPALQVCYELANGSKHFLATKLHDPVVKGTKEVVYDTDGMRSPMVKPMVRPLRRPLKKKHHADIKVQTERGAFKFTSLCNEACEFWDRFFEAGKF